MNLKQVLTLNGFTQLTKGHPWLRTFHFKKSCALPKVPCVYPLGEHWFLVSPQSLIPCRRLGPLQAYWPDNSHAREMIVTNEDFLYRFSSPLIDIFTRCYETKKKLVSGDGCFRWLFSENDGIPGLIVDCIGTDIMAQIGTAPIEYFWPALQQILKASLENSGLENFVIHASRDMPSRTQEGLEISHLELEEKIVQWNGLKWHVRPGSSQKTGLYLDQRQNHKKAKLLAQKLEIKTALDLFCYEGGFGLHLSQAGVAVLGVDGSQEAIDRAVKNATLNHLKEKMSFQCEDVFSFLNGYEKKVDMIIVDPPPFAKKSSNKYRALQGLRELVMKSIRCLNQPGLLVLCSCSHHIRHEDIKNLLSQIAHRLRYSILVLEVTGPSPDHAPLITFPEGEYLRTWWLLIS